MAVLFGREVSINVGGLLIESKSIGGRDQPILRVKFKISRARKQDPNTANVTIYNLNKENRTRLQENDVRTVIRAGFIDNVSQIFSGELQFGSSVQQGTDWITTIQSQDGAKKFKSARINTSLRGPVDVGEVLRQVGESLGLNLGNLSEKVSAGSLRTQLQQFVNGKVLSGKSEKIFTDLLKSMGYDWSVQDGQLQILGPDEVIQGEAVRLAVVDGVTTGLIGSPEAGEKGLVKARAIIQPGLAPGLRVQIQSKEVDGFFRIEKVVYIGDTWGGEWYADIEAKPL